MIVLIGKHFDYDGGSGHRRYKLQREAERIVTDVNQSIKHRFGMK